MTRAEFHKITAAAPLLCSLAALALVTLVLTTGWERHATDEGTAAHLFQLLIAVQVPLIGLFLATAPRSERRASLRTVAAQIVIACLPLGLVYSAGL